MVQRRIAGRYHDLYREESLVQTSEHMISVEAISSNNACVPSSLVFTIPSLNDLMLPRQYFFLQDLRTTALVNPSNLENLGCVDVGITASTHDGDSSDHAFIDL